VQVFSEGHSVLEEELVFFEEGSGCRRRIPDTVDATLVCHLGLI
jgi:hypothetical protein